MSAIKFLAVMQQGDHELFNISLKLYDLDLALQVAQAVDMDPKEYLENLNDLNQEENDNRRKFKIDFQLEHYKDAMARLVDLFKVNQGNLLS